MLALLFAAALQAQAAIPRVFVPKPDEEAAAVNWITTARHPLSGADAGSDELQPIATLLKGARVIGVGEVTHGDHESQYFKANLIRELVREGAIQAVALESNRDVVCQFDLYVRTGKGDPVELMRSTSFFRVFRDEEFLSLLVWLRAWNQTADKPVRLFGFDDQDAGRDADFALTMLARHDPAAAKRLRPAFAGVIAKPGEPWIKPYAWVQTLTPPEIATVKARARELADLIVAHRMAWATDPDYDEAAYAAEVAWQNLHIFELDGKGTAYMADKPMEYWGRRDRFMAANMVARLAPGEHAAVWAHNGHVSWAMAPAYVTQGATGFGIEMKKTLGDGYHTVGMAYNRGHITTVLGANAKIKSSDPEQIYDARNDRPGELGSVLGRVTGDAYWIDLAARPHTPLLDRWVHTAYYDGSAGWGLDPAHWQNDPPQGDDYTQDVDKGFDILVYFRTITPARRLPAKP